MKTFNERLNLQFFADGAPAGDGGGEGAATAGANVAVAGQTAKTLEDLGVPAAAAEKYRARKGKTAKVATEPATATAADPARQSVPAEAKPQENTGKPSFQELLKDEEYNREVQNIVNNRISQHKRTHGEAQAKLDAVAPMFEVLGRKYGIDASDLSKLDFAALNKAVTEDTSYYRDRAAELGTDAKTAMRIDTLERAEAQRKRQEQESIREQAIRTHYEKLQRESAELKTLYPEFDLETEMQNNEFVKLTAPGVDVPLKFAYRAIHGEEIARREAEAIARNVAQATANSIQSGQRPQENGTAARNSMPAKPQLYSQMSKEDRAALKAEIERNAAYGKKTPLRGV